MTMTSRASVRAITAHSVEQRRGHGLRLIQEAVSFEFAGAALPRDFKPSRLVLS